MLEKIYFKDLFDLKVEITEFNITHFIIFLANIMVRFIVIRIAFTFRISATVTLVLESMLFAK